MIRIRIIGLTLVAVFAMSAVAVSSASAAKNGPHWLSSSFGGECIEPTAKGIWAFETKAKCEAGTPIISTGNWEKILGAGEKKNITFTSGETRLITASDLIICKKDKGTGEIIGGWPGTDKATITFEECEVTKPFTCKVKNAGGTFGTIVTTVNTELVYTTKKAGEEEKSPLGILFKTTSAKNKLFVELEFSGICAFGPKKVEATGEEHGPGIPGVAGVVCKIVEPAEANKVVHEIECAEKAQQKFFYWEGGVIKEGKAGLKLGSEVAEQVGSAKIELESKKEYAATGK